MHRALSTAPITTAVCRLLSIWVSAETAPEFILFQAQFCSPLLFSSPDSAPAIPPDRSAPHRQKILPTAFRSAADIPTKYRTAERSEERRVGKECRSRW